jgi:acetyl-CoA C-acetyltransferase
MGKFAEDTAEKYQFTRHAQDAFATESLMRAKKATESGTFAREIVSLTVGGAEVAVDELPTRADPAKIPLLKPAFREGGTVTAANSSAISDGAAALGLMSETDAERRGKGALARIVGHASHAQAPHLVITAPIGAIAKLLERIGWTSDQVDLYEINEAFAVVTLAAMRDLHLDHDKVNVLGGACALGHPIGASGARLIVTLINALGERGLKRGIASLCIGGGEATAMAIELV